MSAERSTAQQPARMVDRALDVITASERQRSFIRDLVAACALLETHPERFPEVYDKAREHWPDRRVRAGLAQIMALECKKMDLVDRRVGLPRRDGSVFGVSYRELAEKTGIGDPAAFRYYRNERTGVVRKDWRGRRRIGRYLSRLHLAYLEGGDPEQRHLWVKQKPRNRRWQIEEGPRRGQWKSYPTVRKVSLCFLKRVRLDERFALESADADKWRKGKVSHFVDVQARRARDREIKARRRAERAREQRIYFAEGERQAVANRTVKRTE